VAILTSTNSLAIKEKNFLNLCRKVLVLSNCLALVEWTLIDAELKLELSHWKVADIYPLFAADRC